MFLHVRGSIRHGDDQFSDSGQFRGRHEVFMIFSALLRDQLWPIYQWSCEETDCVMLHGDDLFLENSVRKLLLTPNNCMPSCLSKT